MGTIITVATSKGGGGKTTLAACLAYALGTLGYRVGVIDADRNQSFASWHAHEYAAPPAIACITETRHVEVIDRAAAEAERLDVVLIDTAGFENLTAASAIGVADFVLIPCMPDRFSVTEAAKTAAQVAAIGRAARRPIPASVVRSRWNPRGQAERATIDDLALANLAVLDACIPASAALSKMTFSGAVPAAGPIGAALADLIGELRRHHAIPAAPAEAVA